MSFLEPEIRSKIQHYCTYQERCHSEVRAKLYALGCKTDTVEKMIVELIEKNYLNEQRYAISFAGGKFRHLKWGRVKIKREMQIKKVSENCIRSALREIDEADYIQCLEGLIVSKKANLKDYKERQKIVRWLMGKGYETEFILDALGKQI